MFKFLRRSQPEPLVVYKRERPITWAKADAQAWRAFCDGALWKKIEAFIEDKMVNAYLAGVDRARMGGWAEVLAELKAMRGEEPKARKVNPEDSVPIQISEDAL